MADLSKNILCFRWCEGSRWIHWQSHQSRRRAAFHSILWQPVIGSTLGAPRAPQLARELGQGQRHRCGGRQRRGAPQLLLDPRPPTLAVLTSLGRSRMSVTRRQRGCRGPAQESLGGLLPLRASPRSWAANKTRAPEPRPFVAPIAHNRDLKRALNVQMRRQCVTLR